MAATAAALSAVRIAGGAPGLNVSLTPADLLAAIATANDGASCPTLSARRLPAALATDSSSSGSGGTAGGSRALFAATGIYFTVATRIAVRGTAGSAAAVAAAIALAPFPLAAASWSPLWGSTAALWLASFGTEPLATVAGSIVVVNAATYSPQPAAPAAPSLTASQQLGLGLGIGISLAAIFIVVVILVRRERNAVAAAAAKTASPRGLI